MAQWASLPLGLATEQAEHQQTKLGTGDRGPRACGGNRGSSEGLRACRWTGGHGPRAYVQVAATRGGRVLVCHNHTCVGMHVAFVSQLHGGVTREEEETLQKDSECRSSISRHNLLAGLGAVLILEELQMYECV